MKNMMNFNRFYEEAQIRRLLETGDVDALKALKAADPEGAFFALSATFSQGRFSGPPWSGATKRKRTELLLNGASNLFDRFRGWYVNSLLPNCVDGHTAAKTRKWHPHLIGYVDDQADHEDTRPHLHAVLWVPSRTVGRFLRWVSEGNWYDIPQGTKSGAANAAWAALEENGELHIRPVDDLRKAVSYAGKLYLRLSGREAVEELRIKLPDDKLRGNLWVSAGEAEFIPEAENASETFKEIWSGSLEAAQGSFASPLPSDEAEIEGKAILLFPPPMGDFLEGLGLTTFKEPHREGWYSVTLDEIALSGAPLSHQVQAGWAVLKRLKQRLRGQFHPRLVAKIGKPRFLNSRRIHSAPPSSHQ